MQWLSSGFFGAGFGRFINPANCTSQAGICADDHGRKPMLLVFEDLRRVDLSTVDLSSSLARRSLQKPASARYAPFEGRVAH